MRIRSILLIAVLGAPLVGCTAAPPPRDSYRHVRVVEIQVAPPPLRVVEVPPPRRGYAWAPGYWNWNGHRHVWVEGVWVRERRDQHWVPAHWDEGRAGYWHFEKGHWER